MFETGYPYIGMTQIYFDKFQAIIERSVPNMNCTKGEHFGICRVEDKCENVNFSQELTLTIRDYDFTIPLENIAIQVNFFNKTYCHTQIGLLSKSSDNAIVLGAAFFTAFVGIFDTE